MADDDPRAVAERLAGASAHPFTLTLRDGTRLTKREREILDELARGMPDKEIAAALGISTATVKNHLYRTYKKLAVRSRTEAVVKWLRG